MSAPETTSLPDAAQPARAAIERPLFPFLPLIYVAWADGDLSADEVTHIRRQAQEVLPTSCHGALDRWLDPENPPSPQTLRSMLTLVRRTGRQLDAGQRRSLADLGMELARLSSEGDDGDGDGNGDAAAATHQALHQIEEALGLGGAEASAELFAPSAPPTTESQPPLETREPTFNTAAMARLLDGEKRAIRRQVKELLRAPEFRYPYELTRSAYRERVLSWCRMLAEHGLGALALPEAYGGKNDVAASIAAFETLAFHDMSLVVKFGVQFGLFGGSILHLGTAKHHARYLAAAASLELAGCFAMSETGHGSNVRELETTARYDAATDELEITTPNPAARKDWIGNAARHARLATVFAQLEVGGEHYGVHAVLVPIRDEDGEPMPGVRIEDCGHKVGLNGVDNGRLYFDQVRVPRDNLLDRYGAITDDGRYSSPIASDSKRFFTMLGTLVAGRVSVAGAAISSSKSALAIAVRYGEQRRQFGPADSPEVRILDYRSHQRRLLPRVAGAYAFTFAHRHLVALYAGGDPQSARQVEGLAAGLKAMASWFNVDTLQTCREACGGKGYLTENRLGILRDDTDIFTTFEGDNVVLLQLVARNLLTAYRKQFGAMGFGTIARYVAHQAAMVVTELNPIVIRNTDPDHLRGQEFQLAAFRYREEHLLSTVAKRIKKRLDAEMDAFEAFNEVQNHLLSLAKAHTERVVLEQFAATVEGCEDAELRAVLEMLRTLWALWRIDDDAGWFLSHGYIEGAKAKAIRKQLHVLCHEARPHALSLVDAFEIPDELLAAPIAFDEVL